MIERVHISLMRVMTGYTVRATFQSAHPDEDQADDVVLLHGHIEAPDLEDRVGILEGLAEELLNLAPRCRPAARTLEDIAAPLHWAGLEVRSA